VDGKRREETVEGKDENIKDMIPQITETDFTDKYRS